MKPFRAAPREAAIAFLAFAALYGAMYRDVLFGGMTFYKLDIARYYHPMWRFGVETMRSGEIPFWNPFSHFGAPFVANVQTCVFYPPAILFYLGPFLTMFNAYALFHLVLASFFTYLWMRECNASRAGAALAGIAYGLSGYMMAAVQLTIALAATAWLPLALLTFRRAVKERSNGWAAATGAVFCLMYLAGDPAALFATGLALATFALLKTVEEARRACLPARQGARPAARPIGSLILACAVLFALAAFQIPLFLEFIAHSDRATMPMSKAFQWSLAWPDFIGTLFPYFSDLTIYIMDYEVRQSWLNYSYVGVSVWALVACAAVLKPRDRQVLTHAGLALFGLWIAMGGHSPLYRALYAVFPLTRLVRYPVRFFFLSTFAIACLAGFGFDAARAARPDPKKVRAALAAAFVAGALAIALTIGFDDVYRAAARAAFAVAGETPAYFTPERLARTVAALLLNAKRTALFAVLAAAALAGRFGGKIRSRLFTLFFLLFISMDLQANAFQPRMTTGELEAVSANERVILADPAFGRVKSSPAMMQRQFFAESSDDVEEQEEMKNKLASNYLLQLRIHDAWTYDSLYLKPVQETFVRVMMTPLAQHRHLLDALGVRYIASPYETIEGLEPVNRTKFANLFKNSDSMPRAYLVPEAVVETDRVKLLDRLVDGSFRPAERLFLDENPGPPSAKLFWANRGSASDRVEVTRATANTLEFSVSAAKDAWLFDSDAFYPGWKAWVDGAPVKMVRANYAFRAVQVPAGTHTVRFRYEPPLFFPGAVVTLATLAALGVWFARTWRA